MAEAQDKKIKFTDLLLSKRHLRSEFDIRKDEEHDELRIQVATSVTVLFIYITSSYECKNRNALTLPPNGFPINFQWKDMYNKVAFVFNVDARRFSFRDTLHQLRNLLPNLKSVVIVSWRVDAPDLWLVYLLLYFWHRKLESVTVNMSATGVGRRALSPAKYRLLALMFSTLHRMPKLRSLSLHVEGRLLEAYCDAFSIRQGTPYITMIETLREFQLSTFDKKELVSVSLAQFAPKNAQLAQVVFRFVQIEFPLIELYSHTLDPAITNRLELATSRPLVNGQLHVLLQFQSLTVLHLNLIFEGPIEYLTEMAHLGELRQLNILKIKVQSNDFYAFYPDNRMPVVALTSVRKLKITTSSTIHHFLTYLHIDRMFPNLECLKLNNCSRFCYMCPEFSREFVRSSSQSEAFLYCLGEYIHPVLALLDTQPNYQRLRVKYERVAGVNELVPQVSAERVLLIRRCSQERIRIYIEQLLERLLLLRHRHASRLRHHL